MFTGIIEGMGVIRRAVPHGGAGGERDCRLEIASLVPMERVVVGESIAVDGVCLTVLSWDGTVFSADVSSETLGRTTLGGKMPGDRVNLERALSPSGRLGGHLVMGHVDCVGVMTHRREEGRSIRLFFEIPTPFDRYVVEKGSIAINGISLTVNGVERNRFDVNVIPHTASVTTIGLLKPGDHVNIETDIIGKYVEKLIEPWKREQPPTSKVTEEFLKTHGFIR